MNKMFVIVLILGFWLFLPIPFIWMDVTSLNSQTMDNIKEGISNMGIETQNTDNTGFWGSVGQFFNGIWNFVKLLFNFAVLYFNILVMGFPDAGLLNYFLWFLKIISVVTIVMIIRGN